MTTKARRVAGPCVVFWIALVLSVIGGASVVAAQTPSGVIQGNIRDVSAGVLPGVVVTATHAETGRSLVALSNGRGDYEVSGLEVGEYDVSALLPGFRSQPFTVTVTAGETETLDLVLTIAPLAETVIVTRTDQQLSAVPQSVAVVERDQIEFAQRRASLDEALRGIPGLFVQNRRNYGLSGGIGLSIRAPQPRFGLRGVSIIQDGIPITTADGTTEPGNRRSRVSRTYRRGPRSELRALRQLGRRRDQYGNHIRHLTSADHNSRYPVRQQRLQPAAGQSGRRERPDPVHGERQPV